jgi:Helicase conserved C-terminal domain
LESLIEEGISIVKEAGDEKWEFLKTHVLDTAGKEKIVFFAQPIETVTALARFLENVSGRSPALIVGGQGESERNAQVEMFRRLDGPQFLVSSRAGGEGINLQVARRLVHIDVPWNPMDMEQRVGRVHRFGSRETIIVDTLVVKDSREADAFRIAREKLKLITVTLVEKERFETVFSRVMCLLSQDELQSVMLNNLTSPMDAHDEQKLSAMVQEGFQIWKDFHHRFGQQQKSIQQQDPGLATWDTLVRFLEQYGGGDRQSGYQRQRFLRNAKSINRIEDEATVLRLSDGKSYVCGDYGESLIYAPDGAIAAKCGLNIKVVADALRKAAFPDAATGAGYLRWPSELPLPNEATSLPFGVVVLLRQTIRMDKKGGWTEQSNSLHCLVGGEGEFSEADKPAKKRLIEGLLAATIRKSSEDLPALTQAVTRTEEQWIERLRRPSEAELNSQIRHSVMPLFAAIITS